MSDVLIQRVKAANPVGPEALRELDAQIRDQVIVLPPGSSARRRSCPRRRLIAVACVVAALLGGSALAFQLGVIDFSTAPAAPHPVVEEFSSLSVGALPGMDPRVLAGETRLVGTVLGHQLWVAPTEQGGLCYMWSGSGGGCDAVGGFPLSVNWSGAAIPAGQPGHSFDVIEGFAHSRWVNKVQITLGDGSTVQPEMLWVSPPINAGFFYYQAPPGKTIANVSALQDGTVVAADNHGSGEPQGPHPFADLSKKAEIATIRNGCRLGDPLDGTHRDQRTLHLAPVPAARNRGRPPASPRVTCTKPGSPSPSTASVATRFSPGNAATARSSSSTPTTRRERVRVATDSSSSTCSPQTGPGHMPPPSTYTASRCREAQRASQNPTSGLSSSLSKRGALPACASGTSRRTQTGRSVR